MTVRAILWATLIVVGALALILSGHLVSMTAGAFLMIWATVRLFLLARAEESEAART